MEQPSVLHPDWLESLGEQRGWVAFQHGSITGLDLCLSCRAFVSATADDRREHAAFHGRLLDVEDRLKVATPQSRWRRRPAGR